MGELTAFEKRLNALRNFTVMAPLIAGVDRLGETSAAEIAFAIFLAMLDEEVSNGKDIEVE